MTAVFLKLVNMSVTASWLVLAVIALRLLLKKAPKALHCALWILVAVRLVCPISLESALSLIPKQAELTVETFQTEEITPSPHIEYAVVTESSSSTGEIVHSEVTQIVNHTGTPFSAVLPIYMSAIWLVGLGLMLLYAVESYWRIHRKVAPSISIGDGIYLCDHIDSPFILGLIRPRIYLPSTMESRDADYVLAHERAHLKRKDYWWKPLGFLLLSVYWFNPVIWVAYILLCRDIELACDEKVVRDMDIPEKKAYSTALLNCSLPRHWVTACPLAFGEVGVKQRVKNVLNYKKPAFWFILLAVIICVVAAVCLLTNPVSEENAGYGLIRQVTSQDGYRITSQESKRVNLVIEKDKLPDACFTKKGHTFEVREVIPYRTFADNSLYLKHVGIDKDDPDCLRFTFAFQTDALTTGELLLPYEVDIEGNGFVCNVTVNRGEVWDNHTTHENAAYFEPVTNGEGFCVLVNREIYETAGRHVAFMLNDMNCLTYEEFIEEPQSPVTITVEDVSPTGLTLLFHQNEDLIDGPLICGHEFFLQQKIGGDWVDVPTIRSSAFPDQTYDLAYLHHHGINWEWMYGTLPNGTYRIGKSIPLTSAEDTDYTTVYAEFVLDADVTTVYWFDTPLAAEANAPMSNSTFPLPGAEEITLTYSDEENQISMNTEAGSEVIITGWPIQTCAFADLTGDGVDEVCCTVSEGFGLIDTRVRVYDCMERKLYELEDRGVSNYELSIRLNRIIVIQTEYGTGNVLEVGILSINDSGTGLSMVPLDNTFREKLDVKYSGVTHDNCSWDITALAHIDSNWERYCYLVCYDFDSRFVSFFDPHVTGNDLIVGVRYGDDQLGAAWFEKIDGKYQYRQSYPASDFSPAGETTIVTTENSYTVCLSDSESMTAVPKETERLQILLNSSMDNVDWALPEEVLAENYNLFDPQYVGNSLFIGTQKGEKYRLLHFEKNDQGRYEYQDIYYFLPERILDDTSLPVRRITTENGDLHVVLITDETVTGIQYRGYMRLTQWPSILVLDPGESEKLHITLLKDVPTSIDISFDDSGTPSFEEPGLRTGNTAYLYYGYVLYYDSWNPPGSFSMTETEIQKLTSILQALPDNAIRPCKEESMEPLYVELTLCTASGERYAKQVNYTFTHMKDHILLTIQTAGEADRYFRIDNDTLEEFLASLCDASREGASILLLKEGEQVTYSHGDVTIQLVPYWNWEYEIVEYTDDETPFGIRGRPIDHDSGWIFYSCWPGGFTTETSDSQKSYRSGTNPDGSTYQAEFTYHYPDDPVMLTEHWKLWSSIEITSIPGNFAIINEGADSWYAEHSGEIGFSWDIHTFQTS